MSTATRVRVKRGAKWLDQYFPGWEHRIDLDTLALHSGTRCICGQLFEEQAIGTGKEDGFDYATSHLLSEANSWITKLVPMDTFDRGSAVSVALGFNEGNLRYTVAASDREYVTYDELEREWRRLLAERLKAQPHVLAS